MKIVDASTLSSQRSLNTDEDRAIRNWYREDIERPEPETKLIRNLAQTIWERKQWLACDCQSVDIEPPLLFARRTPSGHYILVRMPERTPHADNCTLMYESQTRSCDNNSEGKTNPPHKTHLSPPMRFLMHLIQAAHIHCKTTAEELHPLTTEYRAIRQAAKTIEIAPHKFLIEFMETDARKYTSLCMQLKKGLPDWPVENEPTVYIITTAQEVSENRVVFNHDTYALEHHARIEIVGAGPYLVMLEIGPQASRGGYIEPRFILALTQLDRSTLLPARHLACHETYIELRKIQKWLLTKHQVDTRLMVILPNMAEATVGTDFILTRESDKPFRLNILSIGPEESVANHDMPEDADAQSVYHLSGRGEEATNRFWKIVAAKILS